MNKIAVIGNLTREPETGTTKDGVKWCRFSIAVRKRFVKEGQPDADFMRVTAWRALGESCAKYLQKGRKVCVIGYAESHAWMGNDGSPRGQIEITAEDVEFLSPRAQGDQPAEAPPEGGYVEVPDDEDNPF